MHKDMDMYIYCISMYIGVYACACACACVIIHIHIFSILQYACVVLYCVYTNSIPPTSDEVLHATISKGHQHSTTQRWDHVQGAVGPDFHSQSKLDP